jgi:hypothetical protein
MTVHASDRIQVARIFATRRCEELDHVRKPAPCQRCLAWTQRRVDELERAGVIRTDQDRANEAALAYTQRRMEAWRRLSRALVGAAAAVSVTALLRAAWRR